MSYFEHPEYWKTLSYIDRIERLYAVCHSTFSLLETLCNDTLPYVQPDNATIELYSRLWGVTFQALSDDEARKLVMPSLTQYPDLRDKKNDLLRHWFDFKPQFTAFINTLKGELVRLNYNSNNILLIQKSELLLRIVTDRIREYRKEQDSLKRWSERKIKRQTNADEYPSTFYFDSKSNLYIAGSGDFVLHFRKNSKLGKIIKVLDEAKGGYISTEKISYRTRIEKADVRHAIGVLRLRIKNNKKISTRLQIVSKREDGYKLKRLAS